MKMISIEFNHNGITYHAIVRCKCASGAEEYHVTIMNGTLEMQLYGYHVFVMRDNRLTPLRSCENKSIVPIRDSVATGLAKYLQSTAAEPVPSGA